jgi:nucleotide-binding universal stress UspA family protein
VYERILVPLDGTAFAEQALAMAVAIGRKSGSAIHLASVQVPAPASLPDMGVEPAMRAAVEEYLESVAVRVRDAGLHAVTTVLKGRPAAALERHRGDAEATLTVMATHGRGPAERAWLGSAADQFMRMTSAPVLLVRPKDGAAAPSLEDTPEVRRVLVTLDGSAVGETVVEPALGLARAFGAAITITRLVVYPRDPESVYLPDATQMVKEQLEERRKAAAAELEAIAERLRSDGADVSVVCRVVNRAAEGILDLADEVDAGVIAIATHGHGGIRRLVLGSVTDKVVRGSGRPVLVVHPEE